MNTQTAAHTLEADSPVEFPVQMSVKRYNELITQAASAPALVEALNDCLAALNQIAEQDWTPNRADFTTNLRDVARGAIMRAYKNPALRAAGVEQ